MNEEPKILFAPTFPTSCGDLSIIDSTNILPFEMKRIFYIYNNPVGSRRGDHAHKKLKQYIWCLKGAIEVFNISVFGHKSNFILNQPNKGLYLPEKTWSYQINLSEDSIYCVAASDFYIESDYIRNLEDFKKLIIKIK